MREYAYIGSNRGFMVVDGYRVVFDTRDVGMINVLSGGPYEPDVFNALSDLITPGSCFIDVGANIGMHSLRIGRQVGENGLLYCFEPNASLFPILQMNMMLNKRPQRTYLRQEAVFDKEGKIKFSYEENQHRVGALVIDGAINYGEVTYDVDVVCLDSIDVAGRDVVIKIDVEGREGGVINGARRLISENAKAVVMEYHQSVMRSTGANVADIFSSFASWNFVPYICSPAGLQKSSFDNLVSQDRHLNIAFVR